jgi:hypothetical protein
MENFVTGTTEEDKYVLGLDVSTKTIGLALFTEDGDLKLLHHVTPKVKPKLESKMAELCEKANIFENEFLNEIADLNITRVVIEEPLLRSNNVNTVATLLRYNGIISRAVYEILNITPEYISSYDSRKYAFPELMAKRTHNKKGEAYPETKVEKAKPVLFGGYAWDIDKKEVVWEKVANLEPQITWLYSKNGTLKKENYDMTDAYCCVRAVMLRDEQWSE